MTWLYLLYALVGLFVGRSFRIHGRRKQRVRRVGRDECGTCFHRYDGWSLCRRHQKTKWDKIANGGWFWLMLAWPLVFPAAVLVGIQLILRGIGRAIMIAVGSPPARAIGHIWVWFWQDPQDRKKVTA